MDFQTNQSNCHILGCDTIFIASCVFLCFNNNYLYFSRESLSNFILQNMRKNK